MSESSAESTPNEEFIRFNVPNPESDLCIGKDGHGYYGVHLRVPSPGHKGLVQRAIDTLGGTAFGDPHPTELRFLVGRGPNNFTGISAQAGAGQVFVSSGGGAFGISEQEHAAKASAIIGASVSGALLVAQGARVIAQFREEPWLNFLEVLVKGTMFATQTAIDATNAMLPNSASGQVHIYGDSSVRITAPTSATLRSVGFTTVQGGITASLGALVAASVASPVYTAVRGGVIAAFESPMGAVRVRGATMATLAARRGTVALEGRRIVVGRRRHRGASSECARSRSFMDPKLEATRLIDVSAEQRVAIAVGDGTSETSETNVVLRPNRIVAQTLNGAALTLGGTGAAGSGVVDVSAGKFALHADANGITLGALDTDVDAEAAGFVRTAATARDTKVDLAQATANAARKAALLKVALPVGAVGALLTGGGVAAGKLGAPPAVGLAVGGAGLAGLTAAGLAAGLAVKKASDAVSQAIEGAESDLADQVDDIHEERSDEIASQLSDAASERPAIRITEDSIELSVGKSKVVLDAHGVWLFGNQVSAEAAEDINLLAADRFCLMAKNQDVFVSED
jgi:hypothetical protein